MQCEQFHFCAYMYVCSRSAYAQIVEYTYLAVFTFVIWLSLDKQSTLENLDSHFVHSLSPSRQVQCPYNENLCLVSASAI
jgi:hypothetical protein